MTMRTRLPLRFAALLLLTLTFGIGTLPSSAQEAAATATAPSDQTLTFTAIQMIDKTDGWAVVTVPDPDGTTGDNGPQIYVGNFAYVIRTTDGGHSWANVTPVAGPDLGPSFGAYGCDCSDNGLEGFFFLDSSHAWAMLGDSPFIYNQIFADID